MDTKQIKQKILDLAIRGKLVPQNPADEPASVLLERIKAEKAQLIKEGKIKKEKPLPPIEEVSFEIPESWEWIRLSEAISLKSGTGIKVTGLTSDGSFPVYGGNGINGTFNDANVQENTLIIGRVGYYCGSVHKTKSKAWVTDNALIVSQNAPYYDIDFLFFAFKYLDLGKTSNSTAQPVVSGKGILPLECPLPPLAEQKRIVAEIDRWFKFIDELEQNQQDLHTAIKQAKSKILDLAIHGKLVPQESEWTESKVIDLFDINPKVKADDDLDAGFVPMTLINDGYRNSFSFETKKWGQIKKGYTLFQDGDIAVAKYLLV